MIRLRLIDGIAFEAGCAIFSPAAFDSKITLDYALLQGPGGMAATAAR
jgi:hypothetical protein